MITISNNKFRAEVNEHGAELTHLVNLEGNFDYIWNNEIWPKHAPVLFPAIGRSNEDAYLYDGKRYEMPQHGFAGDSDFTIVKQTENSVSLELQDSESTRQYYPFKFSLIVTFELNETGLSVSFNVNNNDDKELSFSLGSHPALNVPINGDGEFNDYQVKLAPDYKQLNVWEIVKKPNPYRTGKLVPMPGADGSTIKLDHKNFEKGLLIIENDGLKSVSLTSEKSTHSVSLTLDDFRYLCIWTKEGANAPFLCLEPFNGLPDVDGELRNLEDKEANHKLNAHKSTTFHYQMTLK